jgi:L-rhamnose mutarotase
VDARQEETTPNLRAGIGRTREAWVMWLKPGNEAIYKEKHDHIWPEMLSLMKRRGIRN